MNSANAIRVHVIILELHRVCNTRLARVGGLNQWELEIPLPHSTMPLQETLHWCDEDPSRGMQCGVNQRELLQIFSE